MLQKLRDKAKAFANHLEGILQPNDRLGILNTKAEKIARYSKEASKDIKENINQKDTYKII